MRKTIVIILLCCMMFNIQLESKSDDLKFVIYYDSMEINKIKKKNEIVDQINHALKNVDKSSWSLLLESSHELENINQEVWVKENTIYFKLGDGEGKMIEGNILNHSFCMIEVKPKSLLRKWFNF